MRRGWPFESLSAQDPSNTQWQRDLSVSYNKIGDVERQAGNLGAAQGLMRRGWPFGYLTAQDPSNTQWQRDLSVSIIR